MFDVDSLLEDCRRANEETEPRRAVREVLDRVVREPGAVADALRPTEGGLQVLLNTPDLTVINIVWAPGMELFPHDHRMWAAIGIYTGTEDNAFFRREAADRHGLTESGGKVLTTGDVMVLGDDAIHSVTNPGDRLTGAIHVYGGDFVHEPRSQWGPGPREERPFDLDTVYRQFAEANAESSRAATPDGAEAQRPERPEKTRRTSSSNWARSRGFSAPSASSSTSAAIASRRASAPRPFGVSRRE